MTFLLIWKINCENLQLQEYKQFITFELWIPTTASKKSIKFAHTKETDIEHR